MFMIHIEVDLEDAEWLSAVLATFKNVRARKVKIQVDDAIGLGRMERDGCIDTQKSDE